MLCPECGKTTGTLYYVKPDLPLCLNCLLERIETLKKEIKYMRRFLKKEK